MNRQEIIIEWALHRAAYKQHDAQTAHNWAIAIATLIGVGLTLFGTWCVITKLTAGICLLPSVM